MKEISIVAFGVYRHVAASMDSMFHNTSYRLTAIIDLQSEPKAFTYSAHNLGVLLHCLEPRPQVFISGLMISEEMTKEAIGVWEQYLENLKPVKPLLINLREEKPGGSTWATHIKARLDAEYLKKDEL